MNRVLLIMTFFVVAFKFVNRKADLAKSLVLHPENLPRRKMSCIAECLREMRSCKTYYRLVIGTFEGNQLFILQWP